MTVPKQSPTFKYVFVPADQSAPIQELSLTVTPGQEVEGLLDHLKAHFRRTGSSRSEQQRQAHRESILKQLGDAAANVDMNLLDQAVDMQMVESISLVNNRPDTGYVGVNMYCDDQAQIKGLPLNPRASAVSECCGKQLEVRGDAFFGRIFDDDDAFVRLDFPLQDLSSSATWVKQAQAQTLRLAEQGDRPQAFLDRMHKQKQQSAQVRELSPAEAAKEDGNAAFKAGDWAAAVAHYTLALDLEPGLVAAANNRAMAHLKLGQWTEAEADASQVLACEPTNVKAMLRRATARVALGRPQEAGHDLREVLRLQPANKEAAAELAKLGSSAEDPTIADAMDTVQQ